MAQDTTYKKQHTVILYQMWNNDMINTGVTKYRDDDTLTHPSKLDLRENRTNIKEKSFH